MRPVAILQHESAQGPGVLREHLEQQCIPYRMLHPCLEGRTPLQARDYSGIIVLGSNHCANEQLPWMDNEQALLADALRHDVPVLGHCFGAQMLARAMGARVWRNPCPNIGWSRVWVTAEAQHRMGLPREAMIFHWHYDTFEIPRGAVRTMYGSHCLNKGFSHGRHWAFQGHMEVTTASVAAWCAEGHEELLRARGPAVQTPMQILQQTHACLPALQAVAQRAYTAWTAQLDKPKVFAVQGMLH
jgi:GMP synthase-like glutamine amidotransferase